MPVYVITRTRRGPRRRRYVVVNRIEDRLPGRAAFLTNLARLRAAQLAGRGAADEDDAEDRATTAGSEAAAVPERHGDAGSNSRRERAEDSAAQPADDVSPYEEWTKGELYDRARELDIPGRSKMNKSELVSALHEHDPQPDRQR